MIGRHIRAFRGSSTALPAVTLPEVKQAMGMYNKNIKVCIPVIAAALVTSQTGSRVLPGQQRARAAGHVGPQHPELGS